MRGQLIRETALVNAAILLYFAVRNVTVGEAHTAFANADRLVRLEDALSLAWEHSLQAAIENTGLVTLANWVYIWGHWPVIIVTGVALFVLRRDRYRLLRNAMFVSGVIGFAFFAFFPVAPPRLLDIGLVDTVTEQSNSYRALQPPGLTNQYAAFPSLHVGWNVLVGIVLFASTTHLAVRAFAVVSPPAMAFAVVATANHFVVDVVAGVAVVGLGLGAALLIERLRTRTTLSVSAEPPVYLDSGRLGSCSARRRTPGRQRARPAPRLRGGGARVRRG
jgi:hypothetical protein